MCGWVGECSLCGCVDLVQLPKVEIVVEVERGLAKIQNCRLRDWNFC